MTMGDFKKTEKCPKCSRGAPKGQSGYGWADYYCKACSVVFTMKSEGK